jgi:hypothetical protein
VSPSIATWIIGGGISAIALGVIIIVVAIDVLYPRDDLPQLHRERHPAPQGLRLLVQEFPTIQIHAAPPGPLSIDQAHAITQQHIACAVDDCPRKRAAVDTLIDAGRMRPAPDTRKVLR